MKVSVWEKSCFCKHSSGERKSQSGKKKKTPNASDSSQGSKTNVPVYRNLEKLRHPVPAWRRSSDDNQNSGVGRSRKRSVILGPDRKSTTSHLDVRAVWRLLLTGTKGLQSLGVAKLTEPGALFTMQLSFSASPLPSLSLSLSLSFVCALFCSPTLITAAPPTVAWGVAGEKSLLTTKSAAEGKEEHASMTVSVETLGGEQPCTCVPLLGWRGKEGSPGGMVCGVRPSVFKMSLQQYIHRQNWQLKRKKTEKSQKKKYLHNVNVHEIYPVSIWLFFFSWRAVLSGWISDQPPPALLTVFS